MGAFHRMSDSVVGSPVEASEATRPSVALDQSGLNAISQCLLNMQNDLRSGRYSMALDELDYAWMRMPKDARQQFNKEMGGQPSKAIQGRIPKLIPTINDLNSNSYGMSWASSERKAGLQNSLANDKTKQMCKEYGVKIVDVLSDMGYYIKAAIDWHGKKNFPKTVRD